MSEEKIGATSLDGDASKNYEAVEMLKTETKDDSTDKTRMINQESEKQVTLRRVFKLTCLCGRSNCIHF